MTLEGLDFGSTALRIFLGELGSKTFFITSIFSAWCVWEGARTHDDRYLQLILVLLGTYTADVARLLVVKFASHPTAGSAAMDAVCCVLFFVLAIKARMQLSVFDAREAASLRLAAASAEQATKSSVVGDAEQAKADSTFTGWNTAAFSGFSLTSAQPQSQEPSTQYGTAENFRAADGLLSARPNDRTVSTVLSFVLTVLIIFLAQADNKSTMFIIDAGVEHGIVVAGSLMGLLFASMLAVLLGMFCERQLSEQRLVFLVSITLFGLSFISLSQAMLHLKAAGDQPSATVALSLIHI